MGLLNFTDENGNVPISTPSGQFNSFGDFLKSPQALAMAAALLKGGAYSNRPISMGEAFGEGIGAMQQAGMQDMQKQLLQSQLQERNMLMQQMQQKQQAGKRIADLIGNPGKTPEQAGMMLQPQAYQGRGMLGGQMSPQQMQAEAARIYAETGDTDKAMALLSKQQQPGFTLKPGETRYDASGKTIASMPNNAGGFAGNADLAKEMAKKDAQTILKSRETAMQAGQILSLINDFENTLNNTSDREVGPLVSSFGLNRALSKNVQKLEQSGNAITLLARSLMQMPAAGFSDSDLKFLTNMSLNTATDKEPLQDNIIKLRGLANRVIQQNKVYEDAIRNTGGLSGVTSNIIAQQSKPQSETSQQAMANPQTNQKIRRFNRFTGGFE